MTLPPDPLTSPLQSVVGEVEGHVAEAGWDQPPHLFALVETEELLRAEPQLASTLGIVAAGLLAYGMFCIAVLARFGRLRSMD